MNGNGIAAIFLLIGVITVDVWIFLDARAREDQHRDVVATVGPVTLSTPQHWLLGCLLLWVLVVPLYLAARKA